MELKQVSSFPAQRVPHRGRDDGERRASRKGTAPVPRSGKDCCPVQPCHSCLNLRPEQFLETLSNVRAASCISETPIQTTEILFLSLSN